MAIPGKTRTPQFLNESWKDRNYDKLNALLQDFLQQCVELNQGYTHADGLMTITQMKAEMHAIVEGVEWAISEGHLAPNPKSTSGRLGPSCDINRNHIGGIY